ncbi:MAG TPA: flagellar M-ring protein FliF C-terminal domain-containing protein, partial [Terracidiphilus sp.]|nr:flagellar M-ring protein FliF C-terminal domain-containing protein [Terracidiphilus sp.]
GKTSYTRRKRTPQELEQIKDLAEAAIGFDAKRGDTISVQNLPFDADASEMDLPAPTWTTEVQKTVTDYSGLLRPISLLVLFVLVYMFMIRPVQKQAFKASPMPAGNDHLLPSPQSGAAAGARAELSAGPIRAAQLKEETAEMIRQKPLNTTRAVQAWLREEPS